MSEVTMQNVAAGMAINGVAAVVVKTASKAYLIKTSNDVQIKPTVDNGENKPLRKGNTIFARYKTGDLIMGYDIELTQVLIHPEVLAIVDGGAVVNNTEGAFQSYSGPVIGQETKRTAFTLEVYAPNLDTSGNALNYLKVTFTGCEGKSPVEWALKDGEFFTPKYVLVNAPAFGEAPMKVEIVKTLPTVGG